MKVDFNYNLKAYPKLRNELLNYGLDQDVMTRLSLHLMRTFNGNTDVYTSPYVQDGNERKILSDVNDLFFTNKYKLNEALIELENSNLAKFGPRSISIPFSKRVKSLTESFEFGKTEIKIESGHPKLASLRPISLRKAIDLLKNDTNSGLPFYTRKGKIKDRTYDDFDTLLKRKYPCILFTRTQEQEKTRDVWGFPVADTANELRFYQPLLEHQRRLFYRSALVSPERVSSCMTLIVNRCQQRSNYVIVSIDFSAYDKSVKYELQRLAFEWIKTLFQSNYHKEIDYIFERFNSIGLVTPIGIFKGPHGVPSGSTFTNEVDSIVQYLLSMSTGLINDGEYQIQGDDGVYLIPEDKVEDFYNVFRRAGLNVNEEKSYVSRDFAIYLQSLFHKDYMKDGIIGGIYPIYRALNRILYQERWSDFEDFKIAGKDYYSIRTLCILENCKYHPLFEDFVKIILKYDKYSLGLSDQGLKRYVRMMDQSSGAGEILNQQYGSNYRGIRSFESYKLVQRLS